MANKQSLGKGLSYLFDENDIAEKNAETKLNISDLYPRSNQPRKKFDEDALNALSQSIAENGMIQPIAVRKDKNGFYEIIAGERRWRAAKLAGLTEVPVVILEADDKKAAELSLVENIQREDLNPIEEAQAYKTLISDYGLTQDELSQRIGRSRPAIANSLRLLDLPEKISELVVEGKLSQGHARALLGLKNPDNMKAIADSVVFSDLSVRQTEDLVRKINNKKEKPEIKTENYASIFANVDYKKAFEEKIRSAIGRNVHIIEGKKSNKIEIEYTDNKDLENLLVSLCGKDIIDN